MSLSTLLRNLADMSDMPLRDIIAERFEREFRKVKEQLMAEVQRYTITPEQFQALQDGEDEIAVAVGAASAATSNALGSLSDEVKNLLQQVDSEAPLSSDQIDSVMGKFASLQAGVNNIAATANAAITASSTPLADVNANPVTDSSGSVVVSNSPVVVAPPDVPGAVSSTTDGSDTSIGNTTPTDVAPDTDQQASVSGESDMSTSSPTGAPAPSDTSSTDTTQSAATDTGTTTDGGAQTLPDVAETPVDATQAAPAD